MSQCAIDVRRASRITVIASAQSIVQPRPRVSPFPAGSCAGDAEAIGGVLDRQPREESKLNEGRFAWIFRRQLIQCFVQCQQIKAWTRHIERDRIEIDALAIVQDKGDDQAAR